MSVPIDYAADACPCCRAGRRAIPSGNWPWRCECRECPVVAMGYTCASPCACWKDCPHKAPCEN